MEKSIANLYNGEESYDIAELEYGKFMQKTVEAKETDIVQ